VNQTISKKIIRNKESREVKPNQVLNLTAQRIERERGGAMRDGEEDTGEPGANKFDGRN